MFVREADEAYCLGAGTERVDGAGARDRLPRLRRPRARARRDARPTRPGSAGASSPSTRSSRSCASGSGIVFVGPEPSAMRLLGDKVAAKRLAEEAGVPGGPWSGGPVETVAEARAHAERLGYPLLVKAAAGGGGRGIRRVDGAGRARAPRSSSARAEALDAFGDDPCCSRS